MNNLDFTLKAYSEYLMILLGQGYHFLTFREYLNGQVEEPFCLLRHDVDRNPQNALNMAKLEHSLGIRATYYFRNKSCSWNETIIKTIADLGHEIGLHYESLSDANGNLDKAYVLFEQSLTRLRKVVCVNTVSMHGRPLSKYDSRDLWKDDVFRKEKFKQLNLLGEVYLDIDYKDIAYINDTGRNWLSSVSNHRDKVSSNVKVDFVDRQELLTYLSSGKQYKIIFQIHPERWSEGSLGWFIQFGKDTIINIIKFMIRVVR